jgi:uncharacterized protein Usg
MFLGYLSIHFIVNEMTDELLLNEYYLTDSYLSAEKKFIEFWERCLLTFPVHKIEVPRYKIIQFIVDLKDVDGNISLCCNKDEIRPFDVDTMLLKRDLKLYNIKAFRSLCGLYDEEVAKQIEDIEKFLEIKDSPVNN